MRKVNMIQLRREILGQSKAELDQLCTGSHIEIPLLNIDAISEQAQSMLYEFPSKTGISATLPAINII